MSIFSPLVIKESLCLSHTYLPIYLPSSTNYPPEGGFTIKERKPHALQLFLDSPLDVAVTQFQALHKLGRSYAGLLIFVEGLSKLNLINEVVYQHYKARYTQPLKTLPEEDPISNGAFMPVPSRRCQPRRSRPHTERVFGETPVPLTCPPPPRRRRRCDAPRSGSAGVV